MGSPTQLYLEKIFLNPPINFLLFRKNNFADNPHKLSTTGLNIARIDKVLLDATVAASTYKYGA